MIGRLFAPLGMKIFGGISLALLIGLGVLGFKLWRAIETIEKRDLQVKAVTAERDRFRNALGFFVNDGQLRIGRGQQALKEHAPISADLKRQADRIRTVRITTPADCPTPKEVLDAHGL